MKLVYRGKDIVLYSPSRWFTYSIVPVEGDEPVRVEASKPYVESVLGVSWMDKAGRRKALAAAVERIEDRLNYCAGVDADGHRVYRLG